MRHNLQANLLKLNAMKVLRWALLVMPIIVLFFQDNGLSMTEIFLLRSLFSIALFMFEIPSGYFSDAMGRRTTLILGSTVATLGWSVYCVATGFWGFVVAELLMGLGLSFISGTESALLYDTLSELGKERTYAKLEGRMTSLGNFSEGLGAMIGGLLATISLRTPFYFQTALVALSIPLAFSLVEPPRRRLDRKEGNLRAIARVVRYCLHDHAKVKWLILYSGLIGSSTLTAVWLIQPYCKSVGLPLVWFGTLWAALQFSTGGFSLFAHRIEQHLGRRHSLIYLNPLGCAAFFLLAASHRVWAIGFIFIFYLVRGIASPIMKDYVNREIESDIRATVLSVKNLVSRLIFAVVGPIIGVVADAVSLNTALAAAGAFYLLTGLVALLMLGKHRGL